MGNFNSYQTGGNNIQSGAGYSDNFHELQNNIQKLVKKSQNSVTTDTIQFNNSSISEIDFDSVMELQQNGGSLDFLSVNPKKRYVEPNLDFLKVSNNNNQENINDLHSQASETDLHFIQNIIDNYSNQYKGNQKGGCGCSATGGISSTSPNPVTPDETKQNKQNEQIEYDILKGGKKKKNKSKESEDEYDSDTEESEDEYDEDDEDEDDDDDDDDEESDEDDDDDHDMSRIKINKSSSSSSSSSSSGSESDSDSDQLATKELIARQKKQKKNKLNLDVSNTPSSGSEIIIDTKYLYSSSNEYGKSENSSDYYGHFRNRTMLR